MKKKILFSTLIITFFTLFYVSFASANTQQMGNSIMGGIEDAAHGVGNVASGAVQGVENIASDAANGVKIWARKQVVLYKTQVIVWLE